jgi:hypothetical protein
MSDSATALVAADPADGGVSALRLVLMRVIYGGTFLFIGIGAFKILVTHRGPWDPLHGVVWSFWAAYGTLMLLGVRYPLRLLPLLLLQFFYKLVWLAAVGYPLWSTGHLMDSAASLPPEIPASQLVTVFLIVVAVDLAVIPWRHVLRNYVLKGASDSTPTS